ncbi:MAG: TlpA family protein disulfide reductase [Nocardioidaceae bacterium]|nr:TlpA family protein disulfide reductase [Nocardioidaceae bacterium]
MRRPVRAASGLIAVALISAACSDVGGTGDLEYVGGSGRVVEVAASDREAPVEISGTTIEGKKLDLADLRGQVVVVNVWWSGCGPCRSEMPMLVDAEAELTKTTPDPVAFVGINTRDLARANAASFERGRGVDYPSLYDEGGETLLELGRFAPRSVPATFVLDTKGRIAAAMNGPIPSKGTITTVVEDILAEANG